MELNEAKQLLGEFMGAWASWRHDPAEIEAWTRMLLKFDLEGSRKALEAYWEDCKTSKPVAANFKAKYIAMNPAPAQEPSGDGNPFGYAGVCVQCVQAPASAHGRLGHYQPMYYGTPRKIPPHDVIMQHAQALRAKLAASYGGQWEVMKGVTIDQVERNKRELQARERNRT